MPKAIHWSHLPVSTKLILLQSLLIIALLGGGMTLLVRSVDQQLDERTVIQLQQRNEITSALMTAYSQSVIQVVSNMARVLNSRLQGHFELDSSKINPSNVPILKKDGQVLNQDFAIVDWFHEVTGGVATIFARDGRDFVRVTTSLKKENGERAVGTWLGTQHPAYAKIIAGETYAGQAKLFGRDYFTQYTPINDDHGQVIGLLFVGIDYTQSIQDLKNKIKELRIGVTGYSYAIDASKSEDRGIAVIHPTVEGQNLLKIGAPDEREIIREMLSQGQGVIRYPWVNRDLGETEPRQKVVVYTLIPEWNWLLASGSYEDEFIHDFHQIALFAVG